MGADRGLIRPDLVFYLKVDAENVSKRSGYGEERFERLPFQLEVQKQFERFSQEIGQSAHQFLQKESNRYWIEIEADGHSIDEIGGQINSVV